MRPSAGSSSATAARCTPTSAWPAPRRRSRRSIFWGPGGRLRGALAEGGWDLVQAPLGRAQSVRRRRLRRAHAAARRTPRQRRLHGREGPRAPVRAPRPAPRGRPDQLLARARGAGAEDRLSRRALARHPLRRRQRPLRARRCAPRPLAGTTGDSPRRPDAPRRRPDGDQEGLSPPARGPARALRVGAESPPRARRRRRSPGGAPAGSGGLRRPGALSRRRPARHAAGPLSRRRPLRAARRARREGQRGRPAERHPGGDGQRPAGGRLAGLGAAHGDRRGDRTAGWRRRGASPTSPGSCRRRSPIARASSASVRAARVRARREFSWDSVAARYRAAYVAADEHARGSAARHR